MDKKHLQNYILEAAYSRKNWQVVLREYFGATTIHGNPHRIVLPPNDIAESAVELGSFYTKDERLVGIYEVQLNQKPFIEINRVGLRNLLKRVYTTETDGALIAFVQERKWRFSYISEIRTEEGRKVTEPKRYTYLFGKGEICRTAADRFEKLKGKPIYLNDLFDAFSVEKLNRDFFKTYKEYFESFSDHLAKNKSYRKILIGSGTDLEKGWKDPEAKPIRDFVKKLLGRIVFLQFLQRKGWMGCSVLKTVKENEDIWMDGKIKFLQELFAQCNDPSTFHSKVLKTLFFETLNRQRANNVFDIQMLNEETGKQMKVRVPYLNGGLFDIDISFENKIDFPVESFKNLLDFFEQYNFTIDENDPFDNEVGIDPEMLGHIFENLLEENREKGAFYTPKEIVHYMCQESLIEYLHTQLPEYAIEDFETLVRANHVAPSFANHKKANDVNEKLKAVKICDPAIGSGAFPMGLLKELFECRRVLYGQLKDNKDFNQAQIKKEIIQQNIYGVDLENGAVEIARLRFWLALVVDESKPRPLPNLDYKIMQGNSLLEQFEDIPLKFEKAKFKVRVVKELDLFGQPINAQISITEFLQTKKDSMEFDITELEEKYFTSSNYEEKMEIRKKIEKFEKEFIDEQVQKKLDDLEVKLQQTKIALSDIEKNFKKDNSHNSKGNQTKHNNAIKNIARKRRDIEGQEKEIERLEAKRNELLQEENKTNKPYFLWHLYFMDVFNEGGFDIMIGNPPYIQLQKNISSTDELQQANYNTFTRTGDIYCLFYEQGNNLLKANGTLCYITSNTWMRTKFGELLRKYFAEKTNPIKLLNFEDAKIFHTATVETNIILIKNTTFKNRLNAVAVKTDYTLGTSISEYFRNNFIELNELPQDGWIILNKQDYEIKNLISEKGIQLKEKEWDIEFYRGFLTGFNDAFFIDAAKRKELIAEDLKSKEIIKPLIRGREIKKYGYQFNDNYVIFTRRGFDMKAYPAITKHLKEYKKKLEPKPNDWDEARDGIWEGRKPGDYKWYDFQDNIAYFPIFEKEKLIWLSISDKPAFALDTNKMYVTAPAYIMTSLNGKNKFLLALLNSKVIEWYLDKVSSSTGQGTNQWSKIFVEQLPIPVLENEKLQQKFELIADYLIYLNDEIKPPVNPYTSNASIAPVFEDVLNMMVYELYFERHMKDEEIDVLKFVNEKHFTPITKDDEDNAKKIGKTYKWLQEQENSIRNRIILSNIRSKNIIRRINSTTH